MRAGLVKKASYQHSAAKKWSYKDLAGGTEVAIKIINLPPKNLAKLRTKGRQAVLDKAEKEMEIHMELVHPNVVRYNHLLCVYIKIVLIYSIAIVWQQLVGLCVKKFHLRGGVQKKDLSI